MNSLRSALIFASLALVAFAVPSSALAAGASFFGPIVPEACRACPCGFAGVMQIIQNLMNFGISISIIIATLIVAWAGFMYITSSANPEGRSTANKMLMNAIIGLLIVLSAWLIVDFVMKSLYGGQFGPWNSILQGGDQCIVEKPNKPLFSGNIFAIPGEGSANGEGEGTGDTCGTDSSTMVEIPATAVQGAGERATADTVENFLEMRAAAAKEGIDLKVTDGYRPDSEQLALWNQYCKSGTCGTTKVAKPCSLGGNGSNHSSGQALDLTVGCSNGQTSCNTRAYQWLKKNGSKWNFSNNLPSDPVHWSPNGR